MVTGWELLTERARMLMGDQLLDPFCPGTPVKKETRIQDYVGSEGQPFFFQMM